MNIQKTLSKIATLTTVTCLPLVFNVSAMEFEYSGKIAIEERAFFDEGQYDNQLEYSQTSTFVESELYWGWNDGYDQIIFKPYYRLDSEDNERSHGDIRELSYVHSSDNWDFRVGIRKEFWGVTEFQHLTDVINQSDAVDDFGGEEKLGQLMINQSFIQDWGIVDLFILPGFREQTAVGKNGRLRARYTIDTTDVSYESSAEDQHLDFAIRWTQTLGNFDVGSYWFHGTNREATFSIGTDGNDTVLKQYYNQMDQLGLDVQATLGDWLWKFESIYRTTNEEDFVATQAGFEYTYVGIFESNTDLGLLMEHSWDSRGEADANNSGAVYQNDLFVGARLAFNDMQSTDFLMGFGSDLDHNAFSYIIEASRRLGENFKLNFNARLFQSNYSYDQLYSISNDDHVQLALEWYF